MRLADFILDNIEPILQAWEDFAKTITPASHGMDSLALRDHAEQMLRTIAADLRTSQTVKEQIAKSQGDAPPAEAETAAETHAVIRQSSGFTVEQMVSEYRALRTSVLMLWMPQTQLDQEQVMTDLIRFNEAVDQALAESVVSYSGAVDASRNIFLGILGHDLRSPLGAILLSSEVLLRAGDLPAKATKISSRIYTSVKRANKIVGDLLDFTRTQLGSGIPVQRFNGDLVAACEGMVEEARAYHPESRIVFETTGALEGLFDQARMEQVFANLIGNAVQHGSEGAPITVSLSTEEDTAVIAINNQGKLIEKDAIASIFNPMVRQLRNGDMQYGSTAGLGLGLHIASAIVSAHKGTIEVHSKARSGTTFTVRIPLHAH
ncbi:sensor histidine kinase [Pseudomonas fluorescens]|uniref:histidine kinase n=1 Tax=Pseudomonas fluorescens TaxID=294 RepID=A0A944DFY1_PSEFL|nr:sensor histidine kinase [Pseudomonas fluorescens]MBT2294756.1 sensor histidine kinase [Pseudomonas fluorescens]MBT2306588.1 sensor histidine kinase [Pseudomonas fluorescens]MBT2316502.1 sensor histidine kinase [Pseudomonas fluorescens]MBT2327659.1 sensor histidine kinase [Pseudomonas fluorescens]MBT2343007.1 sensor histidine kinase [Pseudomonas fluorescens]